MPYHGPEENVAAPVIPGLDKIQTSLENLNRLIDEGNQILLALTRVIAAEADRERGWPNCSGVVDVVESRITNRKLKQSKQPKQTKTPQRRKFNHD
jgi:hypothetical protein